MTFSPANDDAPPTPDEVFCNLVGRGDLAGMMATPALHQRVQGRDAEGWTPLHWAALYGHAECAGFLIAFGADVDARVIAEQVETEAQASMVAGLGVELAQGHLFGKPGHLPGLVGR